VESMNKSKLTENELQTVIYQEFKQGYSNVMELSDGWANMAYVITLADGRKVVLKIAPAKGKRVMRCEKDNMRSEVEALRLVAEIGGVPVPHLYVYDPSCTLIAAEYFIMAYVEGIPLNKVRDSLTEEERAAIHRELGVYNRRINSCTFNRFGYFFGAGSLKATWREAFEELIYGVLADGMEADVRLPVSYEEIRLEINRRLWALDEVEEACLVHWDLWDGNIFIHEGRISAIIDFERAFWGEPLIEYYFGHFAKSVAFEEGYGRCVVTEAEKTRRALYDLFLDLIMAIECDFRQYENAEHVEWAFANLRSGYERFLISA